MLDARLAAMDHLDSPEELRQAAMRGRPILSTHPTKLLIFSPWDLETLGLTPHRLITELPHGNSHDMQTAWDAYQGARQLRAAQSVTQAAAVVPEVVAAQPPELPLLVCSAHAGVGDSTPLLTLRDVPLRVGRAFLLARKRISPYALT